VERPWGDCWDCRADEDMSISIAAYGLVLFKGNLEGVLGIGVAENSNGGVL
jgi:hypothetical protein